MKRYSWYFTSAVRKDRWYLFYCNCKEVQLLIYCNCEKVQLLLDRRNTHGTSAMRKDTWYLFYCKSTVVTLLSYCNCEKVQLLLYYYYRRNTHGTSAARKDRWYLFYQPVNQWINVLFYVCSHRGDIRHNTLITYFTVKVLLLPYSVTVTVKKYSCYFIIEEIHMVPQRWERTDGTYFTVKLQLLPYCNGEKVQLVLYCRKDAKGTFLQMWEVQHFAA